ncbi:uncharacterized protein NECHADRAFT_35839 [Fusarium vanettenii 77-13-4]|uniref:Uncharacterized protein n=1 Tax=Fusarium vanettenii (strain ATCC MYA-4622 / CBS 123669 / FGSC 9596 / NRRL 45880 / 77-13-4) TaxID=660122 RepID=C7YMZ3_FUSV7|nr:uncharacterized protein NECHADRAFT_35839 [Fusarium vanettenii 77-13-4]EEU47533.1 hypothetical protein NECHADRAFT_35839 [Fusarium vanettenii 77-13-4]
MATDPLRLDEEEYRVVYENGYKTWSALMEEASDDPGLPPASLQVEHLFPEHPYFPVGLELDDSGLLTASSTWVPGTGSCDLSSFEQPFQILPYVATPTRLFMSTKAPVPPSAWFQQYDNHLTVLVLAWAYALSARWADIIPQASPLEYTDSQAEWVASQSYDKRTRPRINTSTSATPEEPIWGRDLRQFDRLLTLSCNAHGVKSILGSIFYEPGILCNASGPWLQGTLAVLQSRKAGDLDILARMFSLRSPHLSFLWLGAIIAGLHRGFLKSLGGLLGLNRIDLHEAAWTGTVLSFVQNPVPQQQERATSISRQDEFTLAFLTQGISRYGFPPIYPYPPPGSTTIDDLDLDVRLHTACPGGHGLKFSKITWIRPRPTSSSMTTVIPVDYTQLDPDRDISEISTRNIFMWMREMDGFPINEREIYQHEWFGDDDSDDDERNRPEGDVGSSMGCNLAVTVGGWVSGVMVARCNSL